MVKIDRKKFKSNLLTIFVMLLIFCALLIINFLIENKGFSLKNLDDGRIDISKLVINEIMTSNKGAYIDDNGNAYDWVELYNGTNNDINLYNYALSNRANGEIRWTFPDVIIKKGEYLVVYLSNTTAKGLFANFSLNREGEELLTLKRPNGKIADSIRTVPLERDTVMARNSKGEWIVTEEYTPGFSNNEQGRESFHASRYSDVVDPIIITEFLPANRGNFTINEGFYGYIELQNYGQTNVNLKEYFLSDRDTSPFAWRLPDKVLKPGEIYVVYTSGINNATNTNFRLDNQNGKVVLAKKNKIIEEVEYTNLANGYAYIKIGTSFVEGTGVSPGYPNTNDGIAKFIAENNKNPDDLMIAEVMNSNSKFMAHNGGEYYSWISLYNNSNRTINLNEYTLTTNEASKNMFQLENKQLKPGEFYIVMASGDTKLGNATYKHTNFKLSKTESLYLYKKGKIVDSAFISDIPNGYSYGRNIKNGFYYFANPTPGKINSNGTVGISSAPIASIAPGVYNGVKNLSIELKGTGSIYYTLDGSEPSRNSKAYNGPLVLSKTSVIRAIHYENGRQPSEVFTGTYVINEKHTLPVLSVSLPQISFRAISSAGGSNLTLPAHAELYEDGKSFTIDCGMRLFGGSTRFRPKKSFALKFSKKYGPASLKYKVFDNREAVSYDTLVLRSGSQEDTNAMIRDELVTSIMDDYGTVDVQAYKAVALYINAEYWGIYYIREFVDDDFVKNHYNVNPEKTNIVRVDSAVKVGSSKDYWTLVNYIKSHDMSVTSNYEHVKTLLDIDNYIDFWVGQQYATNNDIVNMRFFNNPSLDGGRIKMIFYDFDWAMYNYRNNHMNFMLSSGGLSDKGYDNSIIRGLMRNKEFKQRFLERLSWNLNNVWTDDNVMKRYEELVKLIEPEMPRNQKRWNNTMEQWRRECETLKTYINNRRKYLLSSIKSYYNLSDAEMRKYFE